MFAIAVAMALAILSADLQAATIMPILTVNIAPVVSFVRLRDCGGLRKVGELVTQPLPSI